MQDLNLADSVICCSMLIMYLSYLNICCKFTKPLLSFWLLAVGSLEQKFANRKTTKKEPYHGMEKKTKQEHPIISCSSEPTGALGFLQVDFTTQTQG